MWINSPALYRLSYRGIFGLSAKNTQIQLVFKTKQLRYFAKPRIVAKKCSFSRPKGFCWLGVAEAWFHSGNIYMAGRGSSFK